MGTLPDRKRSRAILIGTSDYERSDSLPDLPAIGNNLLDLRRVLTDSATGILDWSSCTVVDSPDSPASLDKRLTRVASQAEDLLLVYYAGHGIRHDSKDILYLAVRDTTTENLGTTAVPFDLIKEIIEDSPARVRVLILDCCYSGLAIGVMSGEALDLAEIRVSGTSVLTSVPKNKKALSPPGERNTAYTGELISLLENGPKVGGGQLTVSALHKGLQAAMSNRGLPAPKFLSADTSGDLVLRRSSAPRAGIPAPAADSAVPGHDLVNASGKPADNGSGRGKRSGGRRWSPAKVLSALAVLVGGLAASYSFAGRFNPALSAVPTALGILGVVGLLALKDRRAAVIGAVAMLCVVGTASGAAYYARPTGQVDARGAIDNSPTSVDASNSSSPEVPSSSPAANPVTESPTVANPPADFSPAVIPPKVTTTPPTTAPPAVVVESRGSFEYPGGSQEVAGSSLTANGIVENVSLDLLCIVKDESGNHFPYSAQASGGSWSAALGIGPNRAIDRPYSFTVILATATPAAVSEIDSRRGNSSVYNNEGLGRQLPAGITQLAAVPIQRTS